MAVADPLDVIARRPARRRTGSIAVAGIVLLGVGAAGACWWAGLPHAGLPLPGDVVASGAQLAGLVASVLVCLQLLLIARVPLLVRSIGLGALVGWHRRVGSSVLILIVLHVLLAVLGAMLIDRRTLWSELTGTVFADPALVQAVIGTALIVVAGLTSARMARSRLRYEWWYAVHLSVYLGIFLSFAHQVRSGVHFVDSPAMRTGWIALYVLTAAVIVLGRLLGPTARLLRHRIRVEQVVPETADVVSVWLRGPGLWRLRVRAGQFFYVRFLTPGHLWSAHPYSVSTLPQLGRMRLTIGASGDHSNAARQLRPGTRVLLEGPFGSFGTGCGAESRVLLIAGGSGVGPIAALAREFSRAGRDVVLLHRASSPAQLPLRGELTGLSLRFLPVLGRRSELGRDPLGPESLGALVPDVAGREAFVCGSPGLVRAATDGLRALGVPDRRIHHEELELA
ncbi:ferredoxin reductase family protein [Microlunatus ginsengisoli]|uniref:Ferredoxin reductase family protein n=1 Tax=Microlunatus ginsengisoli TaxID=363863 RepID=A0ABP6ZPI9_9ACTN